MTDVFVFDLGGVLCEFSTERRLAVLSQASGLPAGEVQTRLEESRLIDLADTGALTQQAEFEVGASTLKLTCDYPGYRALWCTAFKPDLDVIAIARSLRRQHRVALLTNNGPVLLDALGHDLSVVGREFEHRFVSAMLGATKPAEAAYRGVERALGVPPQRLWMIDDSPANVEGALRAGWHAIRFTSAVQLRAELRAKGFLSRSRPS